MSVPAKADENLFAKSSEGLVHIVIFQTLPLTKSDTILARSEQMPNM
jgi:hypothetical protein